MHRSDADAHEAMITGSAGDRVAAVVAAHRPGPELLACVAAVLPQVGGVVVVVDEHPVSSPTIELLQLCRSAGAVVLQPGAHRGIAAALNTGVAHLRALPRPPLQILTLDQDSVTPSGYVDALVATLWHAERAGVRVGMVAPEAVGSVLGLRGPRRGGDVRLGSEPVQSGLLVPTDVLMAVGGFDESLFIDGVDTDFFLRATDRGLSCVVAPGLRLEHRLGRPVMVSGRELPLLVAATFRYHYQWRNLVRLLRRHARHHPLWAVGAVLRAARHLLIVTVVAPGRVGRLAEVASGLRAGLRGHTGKSPGRP